MKQFGFMSFAHTLIIVYSSR